VSLMSNTTNRWQRYKGVQELYPRLTKRFYPFPPIVLDYISAQACPGLWPVIRQPAPVLARRGPGAPTGQGSGDRLVRLGAGQGDTSPRDEDSRGAPDWWSRSVGLLLL